MVQLIAILLVTVFWMLGGQFGSAWRKYGIIGVVIGLWIYNIIIGHTWYSYLPMTLFCAALFLGYGEKSWFMKKLKNETFVRIADAMTLTIPLLLTDYLCNKSPIIYISQIILILVAFQIRSGSIKIGNKDFLFVNLFRGLAIGISLLIIL